MMGEWSLGMSDEGYLQLLKDQAAALQFERAGGLEKKRAHE